MSLSPLHSPVGVSRPPWTIPVRVGDISECPCPLLTHPRLSPCSCPASPAAAAPWPRSPEQRAPLSLCPQCCARPLWPPRGGGTGAPGVPKFVLVTPTPHSPSPAAAAPAPAPWPWPPCPGTSSVSPAAGGGTAGAAPAPSRGRSSVGEMPWEFWAGPRALGCPCCARVPTAVPGSARSAAAARGPAVPATQPCRLPAPAPGWLQGHATGWSHTRGGSAQCALPDPRVATSTHHVLVTHPG